MKRRVKIEVCDGPRGFSRWVQPRMRKYFLVCCDCDLVHEMQFRVVGIKKLKVQFRARRAEGYTRRERARSARK